MPFENTKVRKENMESVVYNDQRRLSKNKPCYKPFSLLNVKRGHTLHRLITSLVSFTEIF